ncbi:hypothetical protein D3C87_1650790 [compost metagenome]
MIFKIKPESQVGTYRRFGRTGPVYEVKAFLREEASGDALMRIVIPSTGEELDYPLSQILEDPKET